MLTQHRPVSISYLSTNLNLLAQLTTIATIYQRQENTFHLVLKNVDFHGVERNRGNNQASNNPSTHHKNLIWLEISPYRVIMTQQHQSQLNYRHFWEKGVYGVSRYWLNTKEEKFNNHKIYLRNYTRNLTMIGGKIPESLRIDYELWTNNLNLGHYILHLEIN
ncbi:hypothetical protein IQ215_09300 [Cyanobacterium stanieri LEGE 03274]|uniref:Uncharacterized protein n=1 Tax=Cyanobacterium stanieri LEGE 03274 TaxID=1828756 RepID=A0ABR9V4S5_9CHRO|nr:hypothetical protein [Cyanobacterium stanieri]MBE9222890.1 hypothetical protein [Cyanobacterium stanieri LEGE 03274]